MSRARVDWIAAEAFYLGLDPPRSLSDVARAFKVSVQRVSFIARRDNWREKAGEVDKLAAAKLQKQAAQSRDQRRRQALRIADRYLARYEAELDKHDLKPGDLPGIVKLAELLEGEATERVSQAEVREGVQALLAYFNRFLPPELRAAFSAGLPSVLGELGTGGEP